MRRRRFVGRAKTVPGLDISARPARLLGIVPPKKITLPALEHRERRSIGEIGHVIRREEVRAVTASKPVPISTKRTADLLTLDTGAKILVVPSKIAAPPAGADGILIKNATQLKWQWHRDLEEFRTLVAKSGWEGAKARITSSWKDAFRFRAEHATSTGTVSGLRPAQVGALHAIGAHWSLQRQPATVVMPTGTGKTEAMVAALVAYGAEPLLIGVPSRVLRDQTVAKFETLGLLRVLGVLGDAARNPIVGRITSRPKTVADLTMFKECNVIVSTMSSIGQGTAAALVPKIAERIDTLFVDEAHHVPADSWDAFRANFEKRRVVQFTATPFRRDGKLVDGLVIFDYPLKTAQQDGYFKPITFEPIFEIDDDDADKAIAQAAVERLRKDLKASRNHLVMARCANIARATALHALYKEIAPEFSPVLAPAGLWSASTCWARDLTFRS